MQTKKQLLAKIARKALLIRSLETQNSDSLDFCTLAVWDIAVALDAAFAAGADSARNDATTIDIDRLLEKRRQVAIVWSIEDVQGVRPRLNNDQAWEVLERCVELHDAEWGFNYTHIETVADELFPSPDEGDGQ